MVQSTRPASSTATRTTGSSSRIEMTRISPWMSGISSIVTANRFTDIIGWPSVSPTSTLVKVSDGEGRMLASAEPRTCTGWPRILPASASKFVL